MFYAVDSVIHLSNNRGLLAKEIWEWCIDRKIWLSAAHIPGKQNLIADFESRRNQRASEWRLDRASLICALQRLHFKPDVDLFASRINHQFPLYVSNRPDPEAIAIDAFSLNWSNLQQKTYFWLHGEKAHQSSITRTLANGISTVGTKTLMFFSLK